jgi:hypothetical protein
VYSIIETARMNGLDPEAYLADVLARIVYRAIDRSGALVDVLFSERRDMAAAKVFFRSAKAVTGG